MGFLKWAGGKSKILPYIMEHFPINIETYFEPFLGGGSVLIELLERCERGQTSIHKCIVSDINYTLIETYKLIQSNCSQLMNELDILQTQTTKDDYYMYRDQYNVKRTPALFIYLNKVGFRGLYRENKSGAYNVPYGNYKAPRLYDRAQFERLSYLFNHYKVVFSCCSYESIVPSAGNFIYLDPPYMGMFNDYTSHGFNHALFEQYVKQLKCSFLLSNSSESIERFPYPHITINVSEGMTNGQIRVEVLFTVSTNFDSGKRE